MGRRILIVDDEKKFREGMAMYMKTEGYTVFEAGDGRAALSSFHKHVPDLIILDVMLPDVNGFEVCSAIRQSSDVPIIFLTAMGEDDYYMMGYRAGGDDYIEKPFKISILTMKVARMLEKTSGLSAQIYQLGNLVMDEGSHACTVAGRAVELTPKEYSLLLNFVSRPGRVLTRGFLLSSVWGYLHEGETRIVDNTVTRLRRKIACADVKIKTIISVGYKMEESC